MTSARITERPPSEPSFAAVPFKAALASEWTKLTTLRSTRIVVALSIVLGLSVTALSSVLIGRSWDGWSAADQADFEPALYPLIGAIAAGVNLAILGVTAVTTEYSTGVIRLTLIATPRRGRVLLAKASVVAALSWLAAGITIVGMFLVGQGVYGLYGLSTASLADTDTLRVLVGSIVLFPVFPVIAVAVATLLRSTTGAITTVMMAIFLPSIVGPFLPTWWRENVVAVLPGEAIDTVTISHLEDVDSSLPAGAAALVVAAWLAALLAAAYLGLVKRDA